MRYDRYMAFALSRIMTVADKLSFPEASVIYEKALERDFVCRRSIQGLTAAAVYLACRKSGVTRSLEDIASSACESIWA